MELKFRIDQIAIFPANPEAARQLLKDMGATKWIDDHVTAKGKVFNSGPDIRNEADLAFNYDLIDANEFEILNYTHGDYWLKYGGRDSNMVSHLGMHCLDEAQLDEWKKFFAERDIVIAQEVFTDSHTNSNIAGKRTYHYCIFNTKPILGVDLKFIVRKML